MSYIFTNIDGSEITTIPLAPGIADYVKKNDTFETWRKKTNWLIQDSGRDIVLGDDTSGNFISTIAGTADQVLVSGSGSEKSAVTLSLPQSIGKSSNVEFGNIKGTEITGTILVASEKITSPSITVSGTGTFKVLSVTDSSTVTGTGKFGTVETPNLKVTSSADFDGVEVKATGFKGETANVTTITGKNIEGTTSITSPQISASLDLFSPLAQLNTLRSTTINADSGNFGALTANSSTIGSGTFTTSLTSNGTLLVLGDSEFRGDLAITNGKKFVIPSGITNIRNNEYTWPASANVQNTFLRYGAGGQLSWSEMNVLSSAIVFEDVVPVGVIVRWDKADSPPNTKWAYCTGQAISSLSITQTDKNKLIVIYPDGSLPTASGVIIKIAADFVKRFKVNLAEGITGTNGNGGSVTYFDGTSDSDAPATLVTLKVNYDTNTLAIDGSQLKVKDNTFLSLESGGTVKRQVKVNGGSDISFANTSGDLIVGNNSSTHIAIDGDDIQARNIGAVSTLNLNRLGGAVTVTAAPTLGTHVVNKTYADKFLPLAGGTMSGAISFNPATFESTHLVNKSFVDAALSIKANIASPSFTGTVNSQGPVIAGSYSTTGSILVSGEEGGVRLNIWDGSGVADGTKYGSVQIVRPTNGHNGAHLSFVRHGTAVVGLGYKSASNTFGFGQGLVGAFNPNYLAIDQSNGNVGIGTITPAVKLDVAGDIKAGNITTTGQLYINNVNPTIHLQDTDSRSALIHVNNNKFYLLQGTGNNSTNFTTARPFVVDLNSEYVGIGVETPTSRLHVNGNVNATSYNGQTFSSTSSIRYKQNVQPLFNALSIIEKLQGVTFDWKETGKSDIGLIAEQVNEVVPEFVLKDEEGLPKGIDYGKLTSILIEAVKELSALIKSQKS